ncbi:MAG: hypothetical protein HKN11_01365 [Rhizobiales bacterium]|nr:hypothetical protein [Hyphomicrobiales bacterium]
MTTTQILAGLIGVYFMSAGAGLLIDRHGMKAMFDELKGQPMLGYLAGVVAFAIGGSIVAIHNDWSNLLAGFVSFIGWISLAEGVLMLALRERFLAFFDGWWLSPRFMTAMGIVTSIGGIVLTAAAFSG